MNSRTIFNAKKFQKKTKTKTPNTREKTSLKKKKRKIVVSGYQKVSMTYLWENYPAQKKGRSDHIKVIP